MLAYLAEPLAQQLVCLTPPAGTGRGRGPDACRPYQPGAPTRPEQSLQLKSGRDNCSNKGHTAACAANLRL